MRSITTRTVIATIAVVLASASLVEARSAQRTTRDPLLRMAVDVEQSTRTLHQQADRRSYGRLDRAERQALNQLANLSYQSRVFRRMLANDGPYSLRSEREFRELELALRAAQRSFPALCPDFRLRREFRQVNRLLADLNHGFEGRLARFHGRDRHGKARHGGNNSASIRLGKQWDSGHVNITYDRRK